MTSPTKPSEDFSEIISSKSPDSGDVKKSEILRKLKKDDFSENAMLRSRIEEQGQLICYLKQRTDQQINRIKVLEDINNELQLLRKQSQDESRERLKMCEMLEKRFNELAENHEEMIKIKDSYKSKCHYLTEENDRLNEQVKSGFLVAVKERDATIENLTNELKQQQDKMKSLQEQNTLLQNNISALKAKSTEKVEDLEKETAALQHQCEELGLEVNRAKMAKEENDSSVVANMLALKKENEKMLDQKKLKSIIQSIKVAISHLSIAELSTTPTQRTVMNRGKLLQERQNEIDALKTDVEKGDMKMHLMLDEFNRKKDSVDANLRVQRLQAQKEAAESEMLRLKREFEAFRVHSHHLLEQEKNLNLKLRNSTLVG